MEPPHRPEAGVCMAVAPEVVFAVYPGCIRMQAGRGVGLGPGRPRPREVLPAKPIWRPVSLEMVLHAKS